MEILTTVFNNLNVGLFLDSQPSGTKSTNLYYIKNPDGSVRWIWPKTMNRPLFLKFYSVTSLKSLMASIMIKIIFGLRLQSFVFDSIMVAFEQKDEMDFNFGNGTWALFTGTPGPNRKAILYNEQSNKRSFLKVGLNNTSKTLLKNEEEAIRQLEELEVHSLIHPRILDSGESYIELSDISSGTRRSKSFGHKHSLVLAEMSTANYRKEPLYKTQFWNDIIEGLELIKDSRDNRIPAGMLKKIGKLIGSINKKTSISTSISHGDFTPWNMYVNQEKLCVYDWELFREDMPLGFDAFHFVIQKGILVEKKSWHEIEKELHKVVKDLEGYGLFELGFEFKLYLQLYLLYNTISNLKIFVEQKQWHQQVFWLLNTWNIALSSLVAEHTDHRSLLIMDVFDYLLPKPYAALKFPFCPPEELDILSDIDLCLDQKHSVELFRFLKQHPLVAHVRKLKKSYMMVLELTSKDGSHLFVDLIWKLKRKSTVLMDVNSLIERAKLNFFQVKIPHNEDLAKFTSLFYISNKEPLPKKYSRFTAALKTSDSELNRSLYRITQSKSQSNRPLQNFLRNQKGNRGWRKLKNMVIYLFDVWKEIQFQSGMIVTFSGVDGAGKSTIINKVKFALEKKLRKRVVVLRHRPSILPILSAWTKGKENAEADAANRLPRQGKNTSLVSSLMRFLYYYLDYFFGQFIIYFKYKFRGFVVLYDRYYYDFINDSKRSNIELPSFFARAGLHFLLKPRLNFFLYADSDLILKRKKELDSDTIDHLTHKYKQLFEELDQRNSGGSFISIENINIKSTSSTILERITQQNQLAL